MRALIKVLIAALATVAVSSGMAATSDPLRSELRVSSTGVAGVDCGNTGGVLVVQLPITWQGGGGVDAPVDWRLSFTLNGIDLKRLVGKWVVPATGEELAKAASAIPRVYVIAQVEQNLQLVLSAQSGVINIARVTDKIVDGDWDLTFVEFSDVRRMKGHFSAALQEDLIDLPQRSPPRSDLLPRCQ